MTDKKDQLAGAVASHLLVHGVTGQGIRALAKAAGTSDRMLIYYFGSKETLLRHSMDLIVQGLSDQLDAELGNQQLPADQLLGALTIKCHQPAWRPVIALWFELVGLAVREVPPFRLITHNIAGVFIKWIEEHLPASQRSEAADLFAHLEGRLMLSLLGVEENHVRTL
ncbi:TetR/AcrR family transcriptional regulator [Pseudohongiella spirulinae]|nr:TetR/AcrR family transcriptional regulator [Pseudohongiella spirulinae]